MLSWFLISKPGRVARYIISLRKTSVNAKPDFGHEFMKDPGDKREAVIVSAQLAGGSFHYKGWVGMVKTEWVCYDFG